MPSRLRLALTTAALSAGVVVLPATPAHAANSCTATSPGSGTCSYVTTNVNGGVNCAPSSCRIYGNGQYAGRCLSTCSTYTYPPGMTITIVLEGPGVGWAGDSLGSL